MRDFGYPAVLKSVRMGYDGKGQVTLTPETRAEEAWRRMGGEIGILESFVDFACEISVIVARGRNGAWATYPPVENQHVGHILDTTIAPARIAVETAMRAEVIARHIAEKLDLVGVLAVEMFVTQGGDVLVNEIAPRPHNSGHWTIDACVTSQFEQLVRALCGLPLGSVEHHSDAVMKNLIGRDVEKWRDALERPAGKAPSLRQNRDPARPQDGPRHPADPASLRTASTELAQQAERVRQAFHSGSETPARCADAALPRPVGASRKARVSAKPGERSSSQ